MTKWLFSINAKDTGRLYLIFAVFAGMVGIAFSMLIRVKLTSGGNGDHQLYNVIITAHIIAMAYLILIPSLAAGLSIFVCPVAGHDVEIVFPRLYSLSFWLLPPSLILLLASVFVSQSSLGVSADLMVLCIHLVGLSSMLTMMNFLTTLSVVARNNKFSAIPIDFLAACVFQAILQVTLQVLVHKMSAGIWQDTLLAPHLHPFVFFIFYSPSVFSMKLFPFILIASERNKYYPNDVYLRQTLFIIIVSLIAVVILVVNPEFFVSWGIVIAVGMYFVGHLFNVWNYKNKYVLLGIVLAVLTFASSMFPYHILIWTKSHNWFMGSYTEPTPSVGGACRTFSFCGGCFSDLLDVVFDMDFLSAYAISFNDVDVSSYGINTIINQLESFYNFLGNMNVNMVAMSDAHDSTNTAGSSSSTGGTTGSSSSTEGTTSADASTSSGVNNATSSSDNTSSAENNEGTNTVIDYFNSAKARVDEAIERSPNAQTGLEAGGNVGVPLAKVLGTDSTVTETVTTSTGGAVGLIVDTINHYRDGTFNPYHAQGESPGDFGSVYHNSTRSIGGHSGQN